jgi:diguanylate cyclase (GGDEF)-like protein/PAS domain S-box-containing protein
VSVNPAMCGLLGRSAANLLTTSVLETTHPDDLARTVAAAVDLLEGTVPSFSLEKRFLSSGGRSVWTRATTTLIRDDDNRPTHFLTQVEDFEERRELMEQLRQAALHDPLTGLANRAGLEEFVAGLPEGMLIGVLALDLDRFKEVNDVAGHAAGDEVLRTVSRRILSSVGPGDHAARTGGDEFVVLCRSPHPERDVNTLANRLVTTIGEPICVAQERLSVTASAGVAIGSVEQASALRVSADQASYQSKRRGGAIVTTCTRC